MTVRDGEPRVTDDPGQRRVAFHGLVDGRGEANASRRRFVETTLGDETVQRGRIESGRTANDVGDGVDPLIVSARERRDHIQMSVLESSGDFGDVFQSRIVEVVEVTDGPRRLPGA